MIYTILSACFASPDHLAAVIETEEAGSVAISANDRPDEWAALLAWGTPDEYVEPPAAVPDRVTSRQFFLQLYTMGLLTAVEGWIDQQPLQIQIAFERSSTFVRDDAMLQQGFTGLGFTPQQIDAFFTAAAAL